MCKTTCRNLGGHTHEVKTSTLHWSHDSHPYTWKGPVLSALESTGLHPQAPALPSTSVCRVFSTLSTVWLAGLTESL